MNNVLVDQVFYTTHYVDRASPVSEIICLSFYENGQLKKRSFQTWLFICCEILIFE